MTIHTEQHNEGCTLRLEGRLDTTTAPMLESAVAGLPETVRDLVLDLAGLDYISSAGLRVLLAAHKKMNRVGTMKLTCVTDAVMEVLEMTGFSDILVIE